MDAHRRARMAGWQSTSGVVPDVVTGLVAALQKDEAMRIEQRGSAIEVDVAHVRRLEDDPLDRAGGKRVLRQHTVVVTLRICAGPSCVSICDAGPSAALVCVRTNGQE